MGELAMSCPGAGQRMMSWEKQVQVRVGSDEHPRRRPRPLRWTGSARWDSRPVFWVDTLDEDDESRRMASHAHTGAVQTVEPSAATDAGPATRSDDSAAPREGGADETGHAPAQGESDGQQGRSVVQTA